MAQWGYGEEGEETTAVMRTSAPHQKQYEQIGRRIKTLREQANMSQKQLARLLGRDSASAVYYIEQGDRRIKVFDLIVIARALGVSMDALLLGESGGSGWSYPVGRAPQKLSEPRGNPITPALAT